MILIMFKIVKNIMKVQIQNSLNSSSNMIKQANMYVGMVIKNSLSKTVTVNCLHEYHLN